MLDPFDAVIPDIPEHGCNCGQDPGSGPHLFDEVFKDGFQSIFANGRAALLATFVEAFILGIALVEPFCPTGGQWTISRNIGGKVSEWKFFAFFVSSLTNRFQPA